VEVRIGTVKAHTWKKLIKQAKIAEKSAKKFKTPKSRWVINNKSYNMAKSSDTLALEVYGGTRSKNGNSNRTSEYQRQYSFKDKHVVTLFHLLNKGNKLKLSEARRPDEVGRTNVPIIVFSMGWFIILLAGSMFLRTKCKCWLKRVFWLWSQNIKGPLPNSYLERKYGGSQLYFQKPWVLSHQWLDQ